MNRPEEVDNLFAAKQKIDEDKNAETKIKKCPSCGANMVYSPETHGLKCPYCGEGVKLEENDFCEEKDANFLFDNSVATWSKETRVFRCTNCGATTVIARSEISKECPFCGTSNVVECEEMSGMRPDAVLPFLLTKEQAKERVVGWAKKKVFAPSKFKKSVKPEGMHGNYSPAFTFDADTYTEYEGVLGRYYYVTKTVDGKQLTERRVEYFPISGTHKRSFDDVLVQAADNIRQKTLNDLQPYDTNNSQKYSEDYLYGFTATQYNRDGKACWKVARNIMYDNVKEQILSGYVYDEICSFDANMHCKNVTYKYVLLPMYIGHYGFKKKIYNFFVNGRNGKVAGKVPISPLKVGSLVIGILGAIALIVYLFVTYGGD